MNARRPDPRALPLSCDSCGETKHEIVRLQGQHPHAVEPRIRPPIDLCEDCLMQAADLVVRGTDGVLDRIAGVRQQLRELAGRDESAVRAKLFDFASLFETIILDSTFSPSQRCAIAAGVAMGLKAGAQMATAELAMLFETGTETLQKYRARKPYSPPSLTGLGTLDLDRLARTREGR